MKRGNILAIAILSLSLLVANCDNGPAMDTAYNLNEFGIPVEINGPSGVMVTIGTMHDLDEGRGIHHLVLKKGGYAMNVTMLDGPEHLAEPADAASNYRDFMEVMSAEEGFELISEEGTGAVYNSPSGYNFFFTTVKDGKPISFRAAATDTTLTQDDVERMLEMARAAK